MLLRDYIECEIIGKEKYLTGFKDRADDLAYATMGTYVEDTIKKNEDEIKLLKDILSDFDKYNLRVKGV